MLNKYKKWLLIILGSITWSWTMVKSGWIYSYGMGFWGANGHDGVWHIALIESLAKGHFQMPSFAGQMLQNYHIGFDLIAAAIYRITNIPVVNLYFQIFPPILAILVGLLTYRFVFEWKRSESAALWSTFFVYFGGSFGYAIGKGESAFWSQQAVSSLINPPFALSLVVLLLALISLQKNKKIFAAILFGILIEIKAYIGILAIGSLALIAIWKIMHKKFDFLWIFLGALTISIAVYYPLNHNSQGLLVWQPFWFLETMMSYSDRVGWQRFYSAMTTYKSGRIWFKEIPAYFIAFLIFYIGNLGTRILKEILVWKWVKNFKEIDWREIFILSVIIGGIIIPMFILQKGTPWNSIQFFYYSLFFSAIVAGVSVAGIIEKLNKKIYKYLFAGLIVIFTIPTTLITLRDVYVPSRPPAKLPNEELSALNFLKKQPDGVVLTYPFDQVKADAAVSNPPRPLYLYVSTAYVSAFSAQPVFLEDEINLDITGYSWPQRRAEVEAWLKLQNQPEARKFLKDNSIKYIYWLKGQRAVLGEGQLGIKNIYENSQVTIYQVVAD